MRPFWTDGQATLYHGDALDLLRALPSESVHCAVTSPPYWQQRDYGVDGQIGLEPSLDDYLSRLVDVFRALRRVLRSDGTLWLNLGDGYAYGGRGGNSGSSPHVKQRTNAGSLHTRTPPIAGLKPKDLIGVPWRIAFALQEEGWWLRSDIIWHKPNPMPESVLDRPTRAHEYVFLLSKATRYYYDATAIREPAQAGRRHAGFNERWDAMTRTEQMALGANKRSVWSIATEGYPGAHFATFPTALVRPCILAGTSEAGICGACGAPWERQVDVSYDNSGNRSTNGPKYVDRETGEAGYAVRRERRTITTGWKPGCSCGAATVPATVLDPFVGSGTTLEVAKRLGRRGIGIDLNETYLREHCIPRLQQQAMFFEEVAP